MHHGIYGSGPNRFGFGSLTEGCRAATFTWKHQVFDCDRDGGRKARTYLPEVLPRQRWAADQGKPAAGRGCRVGGQAAHEPFAQRLEGMHDGLLWMSYGWLVMTPDGITVQRAGRHIIIFYNIATAPLAGRRLSTLIHPMAPSIRRASTACFSSTKRVHYAAAH
jgi:hypothetical protein